MREKDLTCPSCGDSVNPESRFCASCGQALARKEGDATNTGTKCPDCGASVESGNLFCPACGAPLRSTKADATRDGHVEVEDVPASVSTSIPDEASKGTPTTEGAPSLDAAAGRFGVLRVASQEEFGREFPLDSDVLRIGKEADADISFNGDNYMSHAHARILVRDGIPEVEDLGSRNGTFIQVRDRCRLTHGDRVLIGATVLEYREPVEAEE